MAGNRSDEKKGLKLMKKFITEAEAAKVLGIPTLTLSRLRKEKQPVPPLPFSNLGGLIRYNVDDLMEWARSQNQECKRHYGRNHLMD